SGLGILGVWVPGLPTTVFILIALWAFSQSSDKLYTWLTHLPLLGTAVKEAHRFQREGTIDQRVKFISQTCSWLSFIGVTIALQSIVISIIVGLTALSCSVFMHLVPTSAPHHAADEESLPLLSAVLNDTCAGCRYYSIR